MVYIFFHQISIINHRHHHHHNYRSSANTNQAKKTNSTLHFISSIHYTHLNDITYKYTHFCLLIFKQIQYNNNNKKLFKFKVVIFFYIHFHNSIF